MHLIRASHLVAGVFICSIAFGTASSRESLPSPIASIETTLFPRVKNQRILQDIDNHEEDEHEHEHEHESEKSKPWLRVLGGTLLVNLATILGVIFLIPFCRKHSADSDGESSNDTAPKRNLLGLIVPSFAGGALIATACFLTVPESIVLIQGYMMEAEEDGEHQEGEEEHHGFELLPGAVWRFGASLLGGFMLPLVFSVLFPGRNCCSDGDCGEEEFSVISPDDDEEQMDDGINKDIDAEKRPINMSLVLSILIGDGLCNFCDGVFVGIAFSQCDLSLALAVIGITFYHEVAQELSDYFLLTKYGGLSPLKALSVNFATGLSVVLGGLLVLVIDLSNMTVGVLLAMSSGVYVYIAACECLPRVNILATTRMDRLFMILIFSSGAIPIGLTLIGHAHCDAH
jgi:zinc transporter ZupT